MFLRVEFIGLLRRVHLQRRILIGEKVEAEHRLAVALAGYGVSGDGFLVVDESVEALAHFLDDSKRYAQPHP